MTQKKEKVVRIAIDGNEANVAQRVGSNAYAFELLSALERITQKKENFYFTILLTAKQLPDLPKARKNWQYKVITPAPFSTQFALPLHLYLNKKNYDVFFTPGHYAPRISSIPYVSSVMDLAYLYFPKQFKKKDYLQLKEWTRYSVKHAKKVIAISKFTQKDVMRNYGRKLEDVVIAYPALTDSSVDVVHSSDKTDTLEKLKITEPYILYVGTLQPRKNLLRLIEAFEVLVKKSEKKKNKASWQLDPSELQLVIAGKIGWLADEILERVKSSPIKQKIILTGYVTNLEKVVLYQNSVTTVLVGLYEGFGIPALEAMAYGSIPVVSETTSLPEVVGKAGIQVDPEETDRILAGLEEVIQLPSKRRAQLLKEGREQVKKFTWEKSAGIVLKTLQEVAK
jgi:glycosyltransferase involved in cell wall biosynthesis